MQPDKEKIECSANGMIRRGAMCSYVLVGAKFCSLKKGECNLQVGAPKGVANAIIQPITKFKE